MVRLLSTLSAKLENWWLKPRSKKSNPSENNNSAPEPAAGSEASTKTGESREAEDVPTVREYLSICPFAPTSPAPFSSFPQPQRQGMTATPKSEEARHNDSFDDFYLQQITHEFADDLDKIRQASDFKERSLPVLVAALKQGASNYTEEERGSWVRSGEVG